MAELRNGPTAPKDPEKKRPFFYIMRSTEIIGSPNPEGKGIQHLYEDDGRLPTSAKIVGNVTEEAVLDLMNTVVGLRKLVHSIGVTIESDCAEEEILFVFQMYGKTDPYKSGTKIERVIKANGAENRITMSEIDWSDDDNVPGQIRFEFEKPNTFATVSVCFYLNDGYKAPEPEPDFEVDFDSEDYKNMIAKSLIQTGNPNRLKKAIDKARAGEDVTVAYIGGSITQGAGAIPINTECYAYQSYLRFCELVGEQAEKHVQYVKAGVGGTPSELGMLRYHSDVLRYDTVVPDVVVVEFAVNDEGDETKGECYDSLVRKIYNGPGQPAVILMYSVFADDWNLEDRLCVVGEAYELPMVSVKRAVVDQFYKKTGEGNVMTKAHFFFDSYHPTNMGHRVMADCLGNLFCQIDQMEYVENEVDITDIQPPIGGGFEHVLMLDRKDTRDARNIECGAFTETDTQTQWVERDLSVDFTPEFPNNWMRLPGENNAFSMDITCKSLLMIYMDSASPEVGIAEVYVDGELVLTVDPHIVGWQHCNPLICFRDREEKSYHVEVKMKKGDEDKKFTILGWGYVREEN